MSRKSVCLAALVLAGGLSGCWIPGQGTMTMIGVCKTTLQGDMRQRCLDSAVADTNEQNLAKLNELTKMTPGKCLAIVRMRDQMLDMRFQSPFDGFAAQQVGEYFSAWAPKPGSLVDPDIQFSQSEITGAVQWAYQWRGVVELRADNRRQERLCRGQPPDEPPRQRYSNQWNDTMHKLYGPGVIP